MYSVYIGSGQCLAVSHTATDKLHIYTTCYSLSRRVLLSPVRQSASGNATNNPPFPKMPQVISRESRVAKLAYLRRRAEIAKNNSLYFPLFYASESSYFLA